MSFPVRGSLNHSALLLFTSIRILQSVLLYILFDDDIYMVFL